MRNLLLAATAAAVIGAPAAAVTTYNFSLTGDYSADWSMPKSPTPDSFKPNRIAQFNNVTFTLSGNTQLISNFYINDSDLGGGFSIFTPPGTNHYSSNGAILFTGTVDQPTFKTGTFTFFDYNNVQTGTLTISASSVGGVPEPASWTMLIAGFGLTGAVLRRHRAGVAAA